MKRTQVLLIIALLLLVSVSVYYYAAVYLPAETQADAMATELRN